MSSFSIRRFGCFSAAVIAGIILFSPGPVSAKTATTGYAFTHLAGAPGGSGNTDGRGSSARFYAPRGLAFDGDHNIYVADRQNFTIRKITPDGVVTTLAGLAGAPGNVDGLGMAARFSSPSGVALDDRDNLYVLDGDRIRKITPAGAVTTVTTLGTAGEFYSHGSLILDHAGNIYLTDTSHSSIRKVDPAGVMTTIAGGQSGGADGVGTAAQFYRPGGIALDSGGNLYVTDFATIRKITPAGTVTTFAGAPLQQGSADGQGAAARFSDPSGVAVDATDNLYVTDYGNNTIRKITPAGVVTTFVGTAGRRGWIDGVGAAAGFVNPIGVGVDHTGDIYVSDLYTVRRITPGGVVTTVAGSSGASGNRDGQGTAASFDSPGGLAVDSAGNVFVADGISSGVLGIYSGEIRMITPAGLVTTLTGPMTHFGLVPSDLAVDGDDSLYAVDTIMRSIRKFTAAGIPTTTSTDTTGTIAVDGNGNIYVGSSPADCVFKVTPSGEVTPFAGSRDEPGSADGLGTAARFGSVGGLDIDPSGNLYVADGQNRTIRKITPAGLVTTFAGKVGEAGTVDGIGAAARFDSPGSLAIDHLGNIFVADAGDTIIRKITPAGLVTTIAGTPGEKGSADGVGAAVSFGGILRIAVDRAGNLYVADSFNNSIRKGVPIGDSELVNLSTRTFAGTGDNLSIAGFVITGEQPKQVLIRACGPALASTFGMTGVLLDPLLKLFDHTGTEIHRNAGWSADAAIKAAARRVGAFAWRDDSADAALLVTLSPGLYSARVSGRSGDTGTAMVEIYDADSDVTANAAGSSRLINLSTRSAVGTGADVQIAGFVIVGQHPKQVLIRAGGPVLSTAFHMTGVLTDPVLTLCDHSGTPISQNTAWGSDAFAAASIRAVASRVGAFAWPADSADSALLVTLEPGVYTAQVAGKSGGTGTALIEVYDADP